MVNGISDAPWLFSIIWLRKWGQKEITRGSVQNWKDIPESQGTVSLGKVEEAHVSSYKSLNIICSKSSWDLLAPYFQSGHFRWPVPERQYRKSWEDCLHALRKGWKSDQQRKPENGRKMMVWQDMQSTEWHTEHTEEEEQILFLTFSTVASFPFVTDGTSSMCWVSFANV